MPDIEAYYGLNPLNPDTDGDGRSDGQEVREGTNPFVPDSNGNVSFAGDYNGTDTVGSSISIRIYGNGRVEGVYYTLLYGYPYNIYLSGAVSPQGRIQMLTSDYLFAFDGQVGANGTASGVVAYYYGGQANWVLQRTGRSMTPAVVKRAKVTDFLKLSRRTRDATNDFISRVFYRVQWH